MALQAQHFFQTWIFSQLLEKIVYFYTTKFPKKLLSFKYFSISLVRQLNVSEIVTENRPIKTTSSTLIRFKHFQTVALL